MHITQVEVSQTNDGKNGDAARGFVSFHSETGHVQLDCAVQEVKPGNSRTALIAEALRQLARMPEYRNGRGKLSFAPDLMGACPANA